MNATSKSYILSSVYTKLQHDVC